MAGWRRAGAIVAARPPMRRCARGVTLMELLAVLAILLILTSALVSGYNNMQRAQKLSRANEALLSTLNLTRNLAISNNAVAYLEIVGVDPNAKLAMGSAQMLRIHIFPSPADALTVNGEPAANTSVANPYSHTPATLTQLAPNAWSPAPKAGFVDPSTIAYQDSTSPPVPIPGTGQTYNNYLSEEMAVEPGTMIGSVPSVLTVDPATNSAPILIGFNPDGTLIPPAVRIYVTDDPKHWYGPANAANETAVENAISPANPDGSLQGPPKPVPHLKVIQLFVGGLVKQEM